MEIFALANEIVDVSRGLNAVGHTQRDAFCEGEKLMTLNQFRT